MVFAENDDMIRALSANTSIESFYISVLPRTVVSRDDLLNSHPLDTSPEVLSIYTVAITY